MRSILTVMTVLSGCSASLQHGSFVEGRAAQQAALATDAADKLAEDYAEKDQAVSLQHPALDPFGRALATELRARGFRVHTRRPGEPEALRLAYVADVIKGTDLFRVSLHVAGRRLSRAYASKARGVRPVGPWSSGAEQ